VESSEHGVESGAKPDHWDSGLNLYCFQKLSSDDVDARMLERTREVIEFVSAELRISPPKVVWIQPASPVATARALGHSVADEINSTFARVRCDILQGYTPEQLDHQIWIRSDTSRIPSLEFVAAHETRHVWQKAKYAYIFPDECRAEGDAYPYAFDVLKRLVEKGLLSRKFEAEIEMMMEAKRSAFFLRWPNGRYEILGTSD
jgi:hypothetical protein